MSSPLRALSHVIPITSPNVNVTWQIIISGSEALTLVVMESAIFREDCIVDRWEATNVSEANTTPISHAGYKP
jgi:hypothetical protein